MQQGSRIFAPRARTVRAARFSHPSANLRIDTGRSGRRSIIDHTSTFRSLRRFQFRYDGELRIEKELTVGVRGRCRGATGLQSGSLGFRWREAVALAGRFAARSRPAALTR